MPDDIDKGIADDYSLMSFSIFEYLFHQFMDTDNISDNLQLLIAFLRKKSFICVNCKDLYKLCAIVVSLKAHITLSILKEFDRRYSSHTDLSVTNICSKVVGNEIAFMEKYLEKLEKYFDGFPDSQELISSFRREIITLKKPIISVHYQIWGSYIDTYQKEIRRFHEIFVDLSPTHLKSIEHYSSFTRSLISTSTDKQSVIPYRRLKTIMSKVYSSSIDLSNVWQFLGRSNATIDIKHITAMSNEDISTTVEEIRMSFKNTYDWITIEELARSNSRTSNGNLDVDIDSFKKKYNNRKRRFTSISNISDRMSSTATSTDFNDVINTTQLAAKISKPDEISCNLPNTASLHDYRTAWNMDETYLIFKGVKQGLKWAQIKEAHFSNSRRTNTQIKDRWRVIISNPTIYKELDNYFNSYGIVYKSSSHLSEAVDVGKNLITGNDESGCNVVTERSSLESESPLDKQGQQQLELNKTTNNAKRVMWTFEETYSIYKGRQQNLSWAEIKSTYFRNSLRTNVNIKDRWRVVELKPDLMKTLMELYKCDHKNP